MRPLKKDPNVKKLQDMAGRLSYVFEEFLRLDLYNLREQGLDTEGHERIMEHVDTIIKDLRGEIYE